jgi:hypothetical protein
LSPRKTKPGRIGFGSEEGVSCDFRWGSEAEISVAIELVWLANHKRTQTTTLTSNPRRTVTCSWLEFAQPSLNDREEMGVGTVRTTQFGAVTTQTREAPCVQVEAGINLIISRRAYELQHSHN